jgi:ATP-dependent metalloprotease
MSDEIGPVELAENWGDWSAATRAKAEEQIRKLLLDSEARTRSMLKEKSTELDRLARGLLEYETLDKDEIEKVVRGDKIGRERTVTNTVVRSDDIKDSRGKKVGLGGVTLSE